jgi:hypothetical protein
MSKHHNVRAVVQEPSADHAPEASPPEASSVAESPAEAPVAAAAPAAAAPVASTLYEVGVKWAQVGIGFGKTALESLARALDRTAKLLGDLQTQLKANAEKPAV